MRQTSVVERIAETMAYDRKTFKNKLLGVLSGALTHYYMVRLAQLNRQTKWVQHWQREVDRLINMDSVVVMVTEIKGKWDKRKAITETLADLQTADKRYRTTAANYLTKVYRLKKISKDLPENVGGEFQAMVLQATDAALRSDTEPGEC